MEEVRMSTRLPSNVVEFLDKLAREEFTSRNAQIVRLLRGVMKAENEKSGTTAS